MLRKPFYVFIVLILVTISHSCSKESDAKDINPIQSSIKGEWAAAIYSYQGTSSTIHPDDFESSTFVGFGYELDLRMIFTENPNTYSFFGNYIHEHIETYDDESESYSLTYKTINESGTWTIEDNFITLTIDGENINVGISDLTDDDLILRFNSTSSEVAADNFTTTTRNTNETYELERVSF